MVFDSACASSYLAFRHVVGEGEWLPGLRPPATVAEAEVEARVADVDQLEAALRALVERALASGRVGLLLSGGIDSAILAALLPRGTRAYTVRFLAPGALDESGAAAVYAARCGLDHRVVALDFAAYRASVDELMRRKRSPLHPVEPGLLAAARAAVAEGVTTLVVGNGADSNFGGLDKLLARDWAFADFVARYTFLDPQAALAAPVSMLRVYEAYRAGDGIDVARFLNRVHGQGIVQAFANALGLAGAAMFAPYEAIAPAAPLDLARIRGGDSKYLVRALYCRLYPGLATPEKVAFARPLDAWMADWAGPVRPEFRPDLDLARLSGEQRFQLWCLDRFMEIHDAVAV